MTFWQYTCNGLAWLLTRPDSHSAALPEWMATTCSDALDSMMNTRLRASSVGTEGLGVSQEAKHGQWINK
ncbi:hypothetical protein TNCV_2487211 [Trichonephila clavipes]|uniref:Uncharacterized protein n=1 Tax=Trichonephila clavipes TaxID=2585209 RepID=A0A8X6W0H7_TRICX|nr:hypothetical protein TNCV_2487211 [Trichonephila clavipes]